MFGNIFWGYLTITIVVFCIWFTLFMLDETTPKNHMSSWGILLIAPWFWPIVVPGSIAELIVKAKNKEKRRSRIQLEKPLRNIHANELNTNWHI